MVKIQYSLKLSKLFKTYEAESTVSLIDARNSLKKETRIRRSAGIRLVISKEDANSPSARVIFFDDVVKYRELSTISSCIDICQGVIPEYLRK